MKVTKPYAVAIAGVGKIARDQHIPSIASNPDFELVATVSRHGTVDGIEHFADLETFLDARSDVGVVALCVPPQARFKMAWQALQAGRHVLLEKPPGATVAEVHALADLARDKGLTLFATWHSRYAPAVAAARDWLAERTIRKVEIDWKEDVRRWHPGQQWIWEAGGTGVFDTGINALSILTAILPGPVHLQSAELDFPANRDTPIAVRLRFQGLNDALIVADFDWLQPDPPIWDIKVETNDGSMHLSKGGAVMHVDGQMVIDEKAAEYQGIYRRFSELLAAGESDVDLTPLVHVADAFMLGRRMSVDPFHD